MGCASCARAERLFKMKTFIHQHEELYQQIATSQMVQKEFPDEYARFYWGTSLWGRQKFIVSCGGAPLEIVKQYIASQDEPA